MNTRIWDSWAGGTVEASGRRRVAVWLLAHGEEGAARMYPWHIRPPRLFSGLVPDLSLFGCWYTKLPFRKKVWQDQEKIQQKLPWPLVLVYRLTEATRSLFSELFIMVRLIHWQAAWGVEDFLVRKRIPAAPFFWMLIGLYLRKPRGPNRDILFHRNINDLC